MSELGNDAFWSALAGVAGVLALALVLEARHMVSHLRLRGGTFGRVGMACYFLAAEGLVFSALVSALIRLDEPTARAMSPAEALVAITVAFVLAVFMPLFLAFQDDPGGVSGGEGGPPLGGQETSPAADHRDPRRGRRRRGAPRRY